MARKIILSCAVTGGNRDAPHKNPAVPVTPEEIASSALEARNAGAAILHIHVREPDTKAGSMKLDYYEQVVERLRAAKTDAIINLTTGPGAFFVPGKDNPQTGDAMSTLTTPEIRVRHVEALRPEVCSLDVATMNFGQNVFMNVPRHLFQMAEAIRNAGVLPELECFDLGHVRLAGHLVAEGAVAEPALFQLCLGIPWGAPATVETMALMRDHLPPGSNWSAFGIARSQFPMVAASVLLGGQVRVGLEDNLYLDAGRMANSNAELVEKAVRIIREMGEDIASPDDAREILGLGPRG